MQLFIIDWSKDKSTPLIELCRNTIHKIIGIELCDGGDAYRKTGILKPDAILVNYAVKPSHGRTTAQEIRRRKSTANIPIYFIDGEEDENERVEHMGICLSTEELKDLLEA